jgi:hypothetical protein
MEGPKKEEADGMQDHCNQLLVHLVTEVATARPAKQTTFINRQALAEFIAV